VKCPDGHDNPGDANFCEKCGKKILAPPSPAASPPAASSTAAPAAEGTAPRAADPPAEEAPPAAAAPPVAADPVAAAQVQPRAAASPDQDGSKSKKQLIIGIVVGAVVIIVVLGIIGAIIGEEEGTPDGSVAPPGQLSEGDCLDPVLDATDCSSEDAAWEAFLVTEYEDSSDDYPGETALQSFAEVECGGDPDVIFLYPLFDGWNQGDRQIVCLFEL